MAFELLTRVDESAIGSTIAREVRSDDGVTICFADNELSPALLLKLKGAGVHNVYVKRTPARVGARRTCEDAAELDRKFARAETHPVTNALKQLIANKAKEKARGGCR